jgi:hypothetical protein
VWSVLPPPRKKPPVPIGYEAGWAPEPIWTAWRSKHSWPYCDSNSDPSVVQPEASRYTDCALSANHSYVRHASEIRRKMLPPSSGSRHIGWGCGQFMYAGCKGYPWKRAKDDKTRSGPKETANRKTALFRATNPEGEMWLLRQAIVFTALQVYT